MEFAKESPFIGGKSKIALQNSRMDFNEKISVLLITKFPNPPLPFQSGNFSCVSKITADFF